VFDYWDQVEQTRDYRDALADAAAAADCLSRAVEGLPLFAVGYSFGAVTATVTAVNDARFAAMAGIAPPLKRIAMEHLAACGKPCLLASGTDDFVHDADVAARLAGVSGPRVRYERIAGADHFFRGRETDLVVRVREFIDQHNADQQEVRP
jgi:alpha/beta superfamily hydrolase